MRYVSTKAYQGFKFSCGWGLSAKYKKVQKDWYLGNDQTKADYLENFIKNEWKKCTAKGNPIWTAESIQTIQTEKTNLYGTNAVKLPSPPQPPTNEPEIDKITFYQAIDDFTNNVIPTITCNKLHKEHLRQRVGWLKRCTPDFPVDELNYDQLSKMAAYWKSRPQNKNADENTSQPISIATVDIAISTLKRFCNWLYDSEKWHSFRGWQKLLSLSNYKPELTDDELLQQSQAVVSKVNNQRYTIEELQILYQNASPLTQKYILFALNCGFTQLEIASLMRGEIFLKENPPIIARGRHKTTKINKPIVSKWLLWPETIEVCKKFMEGTYDNNNTVEVKPDKVQGMTSDGVPYKQVRKAYTFDFPGAKKIKIGQDVKWSALVPLQDKDYLFGKRLVYTNEDNIRIDLIRNNWFRLLNKLEGQVRPLGFKFLRKTGADMIREIADSTIAQLYLSHTPTTTADRHYIGQSYDKLFEALKEMRQRLNPIFEPKSENKTSAEFL